MSPASQGNETNQETLNKLQVTANKTEAIGRIMEQTANSFHRLARKQKSPETDHFLTLNTTHGT